MTHLELASGAMFQKNQFQKLAEQLAEMMTASRDKIRAGLPDEALTRIATMHHELEGALAASLPRFDAATALSLLGPEKARLHAQILELEADALDAAGQLARAEACRKRAAALKKMTQLRGGP